MLKLYSYNNWHYKNSTQLFFDSQIFFTDKKCSIKRNWFAHDHSFFFFHYFAFVHYHAKINISDLTKLKE